MKKNSKREFNVREAPSGITTLNRNLILALVFIIIIFIVWIFIISFGVPNKKEVVIKNLDTSTTVSPIIQALPKNYQDREAINKFTQQDEITELKKQTSTLQTQLMELHDQLIHSESNSHSLLEARKSNLFFTNAQPPATLINNTVNTNRNNSQNGNDDYAQQNMQHQKANFLKSTDEKNDVYNQYHLIKPVSPYEVQAGTIISASLLTEINTSLPGDIVAQVRQDIFDTVRGAYLLIPKGAKLLGKYDSNVSYGQERVLIVFNRIIRPDGSSIQLNNFTGSDLSGSAGFKANVNNHWDRILGAATISTMLSFGAGVVADRNTGANPYYPSTQQGALVGAANGMSQAGQLLTSRASNIQPTLTVPAGFGFNVIVNKDLILEPYIDACV